MGLFVCKFVLYVYLILYMCVAVLCDMELQFPWGNLPKGLIKSSTYLLSLVNKDYVFVHSSISEYDAQLHLRL